MSYSETDPVLRLEIRNVGHCPSFKNRKIAVLHQTNGKQMSITPKKIKERMQELENAIVSALYSLCQTTGPETHSECWKRLRTVLSGLCDDSIKEIPSGEWDSQRVAAGEEGMIIEIRILE